jgi:hypothetical protein
MKKFIAACGINCGDCGARIATINNDDAKRKEVAAQWSKAYEADLDIESINCTGCMEEGVKFAHCNECEYRECVTEMGITNCSECDDYPCEELEQFLEHVPEAKVNLEELRRSH